MEHRKSKKWKKIDPKSGGQDLPGDAWLRLGNLISGQTSQWCFGNGSWCYQLRFCHHDPQKIFASVVIIDFVTNIINFTLLATNILNFAITITDLINSGEVATELGCVLALKKIGWLTGGFFSIGWIYLTLLEQKMKGLNEKKFFRASFWILSACLSADYLKHNIFSIFCIPLRNMISHHQTCTNQFSADFLKVSRQNMICRRGLELWLDALRPLIKDSLSW